MQFSDFDFSGMKYPVHSVSDKQLLTKIPPLKEIYDETVSMISEDDESHKNIMAWQSVLSKEQLLKYVVLVYHRNSPLTENSDIISRKKTALELIGVDLRKADKNEKEKKLFAAIILAHHEFTGYLSLNFLKFENNLKWTQLVRVMEAWEDAMFQMQQDPDGTEKKSSVEIANFKTKLYEGARTYREDIDRLSSELMQDDLALQNILSSHLFIEKRRRRLLTPEDYASLTTEEREEEFRGRGLLN